MTVGVIHLGLGPVPEESPDVGVVLDVRLARVVQRYLQLASDWIAKASFRFRYVLLPLLRLGIGLSYRPLFPNSSGPPVLVGPQLWAAPTKSPRDP